MPDPTQGALANNTGTALERFIAARLSDLQYRQVHKRQFEPATFLDQPIFTRQFYLGQGIYETNLFCDFIIYHPVKWPDCLVIESKWQQSGGSVDEKFPYLVENLKQRCNYPSIVLLDGGGYKAGAEKWLREQVDDKLLHIFSMAEFQAWTNKGNL